MVYIAMLFSWFAWHAEDHDLHSLNYLHMGAGKTWYGVPRDAAVAFEEVVRVDGYAGEFNPLVTFLTLGEKTTVMSPEVFVRVGIPCCRDAQNERLDTYISSPRLQPPTHRGRQQPNPSRTPTRYSKLSFKVSLSEPRIDPRLRRILSRLDKPSRYKRP